MIARWKVRVDYLSKGWTAVTVAEKEIGAVEL